MILAIQLLDTVDVDNVQRQNILANVKYDENNSEIYEDMKKSIELLKESLVELKKDDSTSMAEDNDVLYGDSRKDRQGRSTSQGKSPSYERRNSQGRNRSRSAERNNKYWKHGQRRRSSSRNRQRDRRRNWEEEDIRIAYNIDLEKGEEVLMNIHSNFNRIVLDCGATKTVAGSQWMTLYLDMIDKETKTKIRKNHSFKHWQVGK